MYSRKISTELVKSLEKYPVLTLTGPRQSGKTTLVRQLFSDFDYYSLEDPDIRQIALSDPRGLLSRSKNSVIFDEIQKTPQLTSYLQSIVDDPKDSRKFVLTGSHSMLLVEAVSQSLAGRTRVFELLPLSRDEISDSKVSLQEVIFKGGYPRIHDMNLDPTDWYKEYFKLYVERDIRLLTQIQDLEKFERFIRLCAGRIGQLVNLSSLGNEAGVSQPTADSWLAALKSSYVVFTLQPHFKNFNRRTVKTPKIYFYDTGLACYLLQLQQSSQLGQHHFRGSLFENYVIAETLKQYFNQGKEAPIYFWRDQKGHEIDLIEDRSDFLYPTEIKMTETFQAKFTKNLEYFNKLQQRSGDDDLGRIIWSSDEAYSINGYCLKSWRDF